jgi:hypothetical protein
MRCVQKEVLMRLLISFALILATQVSALAKKPPHSAEPKAQYFDFDDDKVEAGANLPAGELLSARKQSEFPSLIRVRTTFVPELIASADEK